MDYLRRIDYETAEFADLYDELPLWSAPFGLMLLERAPIVPGTAILDVGAGTGFMAVELAQRCGADATVIAVDPWRAAIARLHRRLNQWGIHNVRTIVQDAAMVDLPPASIDLIVSNLGINNFENPDDVLQTCFRVAKPGARFLLTTNLVGHMAEFYDVYRAVLVESGFADHIAALDAHVNHRATVDSVRKQLTRAGFDVLKVDTAVFRERFAHGSALLRHYRIRSGFIQGWKSVAAADSVEIIFTALERRLNQIASTRGGLTLTIPMACFDAQKPPMTA
jgi:ubiquinone/menaquinone biosynthesis C-methylase UbiE